MTPAPGDTVYIKGRPSTAVVVLAVDALSQMMWVRPQGGRPLSVPITDQWIPWVPQPTVPNVWHVVTPTAISRGFNSRALVMANLPADAIALMHVNADATVDFEWGPTP